MTAWDRKNLQLMGHLDRYLKKARKAGMSYHEIADVLSIQNPSVSYATVARWCKSLGIEKATVSPWEGK